MPLFGRRSGGGNSFFQKVSSLGGRAISSVGKLAGSVSKVAGRAGDILSKVGDVVNSPLAQQIVGRIAPSQLDNLAKVQSGVNKATSLSQQVGATAGKVADITSPASYFGQNPVPAVRNAIERAKDIGADIGGIKQTLFL
jgi:hypothetical protein